MNDSMLYPHYIWGGREVGYDSPDALDPSLDYDHSVVLEHNDPKARMRYANSLANDTLYWASFPWNVQIVEV
jgi:hypothetical protein